MMLLELDAVQFGFGAVDVIRGVSLAVARGELVGILGPNGSGKTTLLRLMAGSLQPQAGRVRLAGQDVRVQSRRDLARRLAVVPQETHLAFDYSAIEIVLMGRYPHLGAFEMEGRADLAVAADALAATGTAGLAERPFQTLSGGEKQRVIIASALAQLSEPNGTSSGHGPLVREGTLLLLDEPTASLDLRYQLEIAAVLGRLHDERNLTIVLSTHDLRFAASICTRTVLLSRGRMLADGPPRAVLTPETVGQLYEVEPALAAPLLPG